MLTLERLNELRGIKSNTSASKTSVSQASSSVDKNVSSTVYSSSEVQVGGQSSTQAMISQPKHDNPPVEIPCKNYSDEKGHFAYIDANTHQIMHVNLETGKIYSQDDVNRLSLQHSVQSLSTEYQTLVWSQVINSDTLFDQFGSPVFTFEEIQKAVDRASNANNVVNQEISGENNGVTGENAAKTDPWGLPL